MQRKTFRKMLCPVARTLDRVGEWWSMLILRDAFHGLTRFEQFQTSLEIAPNMLTRRLNALVDEGLLERRRYSEHPPRYEYLLTEMGRDFWPVLVAFSVYGNRHFAEDGIAGRLVDAETGRPVDPVLIDRESGDVLDRTRYTFGPGPAADAALRMRMRYTEQRRAKKDGREEWDAYVKLREEARRLQPRTRKRATGKRPRRRAS
jgi:DNA-binding HxlR family transcriptional regulator